MKYSIFFLAICFLIGCGDTEPGPSTNPDEVVDLAELRQDIATHVTNEMILPSFQDLDEKGEMLNEAADAFKENISEDNFANLRDQHQDFWNTWQKVSLFYFGPSINNGLNGSLNTYPIDEEKIENNISTGTYQLGTLGNQDAEGLPALDYLLNNVDELSPLTEFSENRIDYIIALIEMIQSQVSTTKDDWENGSFVDQFTGSDATGTDVGSALGLIVNAIDLHFQRIVRDGKVAIPAGVRSAGIPRPNLVEARYGKYSTSLLLTSLKAYQDYFNGKSTTRDDGPSILEYLREIDQTVLADQIDNHFDILIDKVELLDPSILQQIETDNEALIDVFLSMQDLVAIFKTDMASVMGISITNQDNDGD